MDSLERRIVRTYMRDVSIATHQLESYNHMINYGIQKVMDDFPPIVLSKGRNKYVVEFGQTYMESPCIVEEDRQVRYITPKEARDRDLFYDGTLMVDILERTINPEGELVEEKRHTRYPIAKIPVMIGSVKCNLYGRTKDEWMRAGECEYDVGGFFIIKGKERVLISQERKSYNTIFVFQERDAAKRVKCAYFAEIRSMSEETGHSVLTQAIINETGRAITFSLPYIKDDINVGIVFRAFGVETVEELKKYISPHPYAEPFLRRIERGGRVDAENNPLPTRKECLEHIGESSLKPVPKDAREKYAEQVLENEIFPHLGISDRKEKIVLLGTMVDKVIRTFIGMRSDDDRDNISLKRVETAGVLILDLFRMLVKRTADQLKQNLEKRQDVSSSLGRIQTITNGIRYAFSTGNWGIQKNNYIRNGVSQILLRLSYMSYSSYLRRVVKPDMKEGKDSKIRQLHPTHFGMICPAETPEGHQVGIVKNMAVFARISTRANSRVVRGNVEKMQAFTPFDGVLEHPDWTKVIHNGVVIGCCSDPDAFVREFRQLRVRGIFHVDTSASYNRYEGELLIYSDEGRFLRPFLTIDETGRTLRVERFRDSSNFTWEELLDSGCVVYLDSLEIESSVIAIDAEDVAAGGFDVCELHPTAIFSNTALSIPFPDHSQAPRNCYSSSMTKQALGTNSMAYQHRFDTANHQMHYPQRALVSTEIVEHSNQGQMPYGINAVIAVATYGGYNQEDSVIINKAAIDRGAFVTTAYHSYTLEEKKKSSKIYDTVEVPPVDARDSLFNYSKLEDDGIVAEGTPVFKNDVIIGRTCTKCTKEDKQEITDSSLVLKAGEAGVVDKVMITYNAEGFKTVKVRIRTQRIPEIGDKFCSRHGQKGTCGMILNQEDMPVTEQGIVPDIIINPHAFPSRMTINYLLEVLLGKTGALQGERKDSTAFTPESKDPVHRIMADLKALGFKRDGNERLLNGMTGELFNAAIFTGVCYYQRLKHLVSEKMHARATGNVTMLARQPLEGRSRDGGLRCGEMERDCLIAHGVSSFVKERMFLMSDPYQVHVCDQCGFIMSGLNACRMCNTSQISKVNIPYACKLLLQELNAMCIKTTIETRPSKKP